LLAGHGGPRRLAAVEELAFQAQVAQVQSWFATERFKRCARPYSAEDVVRLRAPIPCEYQSNFTAKKMWAMCNELRQHDGYSHTFGCLDTVQVLYSCVSGRPLICLHEITFDDALYLFTLQVVQMAKYLSSVYVSGWQCSSTASATNEPGPDLADYPYTTVPLKVQQLFLAQIFHARKQCEERSRMTQDQRAATIAVDYLRPIIADGDTGHGGLTSVMKLVKVLVVAAHWQVRDIMKF
jgi:isocitrate lyase